MSVLTRKVVQRTERRPYTSEADNGSEEVMGDGRGYVITGSDLLLRAFALGLASSRSAKG
jgi:hypothetical protein